MLKFPTYLYIFINNEMRKFELFDTESPVEMLYKEIGSDYTVHIFLCHNSFQCPNGKKAFPTKQEAIVFQRRYYENQITDIMSRLNNLHYIEVEDKI